MLHTFFLFFAVGQVCPLSSFWASRPMACSSPPVDVISQMDQHIVSYMLSDAVAPSTRAGYEGYGLPMWLQFLHSLPKQRGILSLQVVFGYL